MTEASAADNSRFTTRLVKGSLWVLIGQIAPLFVSLVTAPIVIRLLGAEAYGVLALLVVIPQYFYFADLGMSHASTRFGAGAYAEGDLEKEGRIVRTAVLIASAVSVPIAALLALFSREVAVLFNVPERLLGETSFALKIVAATLVLTLIGLIVNSPQLARLRMGLNTLVTSGTRMAGMIATPLVIYLGYGLVGATVVLFLAALLNVVGHIAVSGSLLPQLLRLGIDRTSFRSLLKFGWPLSIATIASMGLAVLERGALSALSSVTELAYYSVAFSLASILFFASEAMKQSLVPVFSLMQSEAETERLNAIYNRAIRLITIAMLPVIGLAGIAGEFIITVFAGPDFGREGTLPFYALLVGITCAIGAHTASSALVASGRTDLIARVYWLELPPYVLIVWLLITRYGALGAAVAWAIRVALDAVVQYALASRYAGVRFDRGSLPSLFTAAAIAFVPFVSYLIFGLGTLAGIAIWTVGVAVYATFILRYVLRPEEKAWALEIFRSRVAV